MATVIDVRERRAPAPISTAWIWSRLSFQFCKLFGEQGYEKGIRS